MLHLSYAAHLAVRRRNHQSAVPESYKISGVIHGNARDSLAYLYFDGGAIVRIINNTFEFKGSVKDTVGGTNLHQVCSECPKVLH